ncbi:hypothetical protein CCO03_18270 [Comamonas serinivorans]|uniref:Uncharacterized protein n=2 Tax=Comamonas serinivorans TaxID=1082851 RepID=A0A1Y0ES67_9BURK|nr:hypothetical protein CCO03_18270 [Comamonas serinivorans]
MGHGLAVLAVAVTTLTAGVDAQAQNSREAIEAVRKHRAEQSQQQGQRSPAPAAKAAPRSTKDQPYRSSADPSADPNASLKSCMDHVGMNPVARDRCMRQHCQGRWGQGACPASGGNVIGDQGGRSNTPLGKCLTEAGNNPFRRNACGWAHCKNDWSSAECKALAPQHTQPSN